MGHNKLNQFVNGLNQNRSLRIGIYLIEMNRDFPGVDFGREAKFRANLNLCVKRWATR
jgi:hypothetical protein